ncbi:MAG: GAF domain-containing protein [Armatimonadota bacterium]
MRSEELAPAGVKPASAGKGLDSLTSIEKTQQRLWLLAFVLFVLISVSLLMIDAASSAAERFIYGVTNKARALMDHYAVALAFLTTLGLICAYFREKLIMVRNQNRELVRALDANARILALRNHQLDTWERLGHRLITEFNLPMLLDLIVRTAAEVTESDCAAVIVSEPGTPHLRLAAIHQRGLQTELARRVAARVIAKGEPVHITPANNLPELDRPDLSWDGVGGLVASPLVAGDAVTGCLLVGRLEPAEPYPDSVASVLRSFADQASIALEKAQLYADSQQQVQRLSRLLAELQATRNQLAQSRALGQQPEPDGEDPSPSWADPATAAEVSI